MPKWDEPASRKHRRKTLGRLDKWSERHRIHGLSAGCGGLRCTCVNVCTCLETVWSPKRLAGVPLGGGQGLPGRPPSTRPHWVAAVSESLKRRSSGLPDEWEASVNLQGRMKGPYFKGRISDVEHICAEVPVRRWRWSPSRLFEAVALDSFLSMSASSR